VERRNTNYIQYHRLRLEKFQFQSVSVKLVQKFRKPATRATYFGKDETYFSTFVFLCRKY
jgi:hypothetical protein